MLLGLEGETPEQVDVTTVDNRLACIREQGQLFVLGRQTISFEEKKHLLFRRKSLPYHPNGLRFTAHDSQDNELVSKIYYSVGDGD